MTTQSTQSQIEQSLRFVASITVCPSDIRKLIHHISMAGTVYNPLDNVLITPLFVEQGSLALTRSMAADGAHVMFDSGGYYVQIGRLTYDELYMPLLNAYRTHRWASLYTLPDHVPLSQDKAEMVEFKVRNTINRSQTFFEEMPDELKDRAMPVVHGHTQKQIDKCLKAYINMGVKWIGFGSFGTQGANSEVNVATQNAVELAKYTINIAHSYNIRIHLFGLGAPPLVAMIKGIGADSFDSASWLKAAGFGMVSLPFTRFYNISHQNQMSEIQRGIEPHKFEALRQITGHNCALCDDLIGLQEKKMFRAAHNLISLSESVAIVNSNDHARIAQIYSLGSIKYRGEFTKWLS